MSKYSDITTYTTHKRIFFSFSYLKYCDRFLKLASSCLMTFNKVRGASSCNSLSTFKMSSILTSQNLRSILFSRFLNLSRSKLISLSTFALNSSSRCCISELNRLIIFSFCLLVKALGCILLFEVCSLPIVNSANH